MEVHDFGPASKYLFRPCELGEDFFDQMEEKAVENQSQKASEEAKEPVAV
jgi:hypothetical protein